MGAAAEQGCQLELELDFFLELLNSIFGLVLCAVLGEHSTLPSPVALVPHDRPIHLFGSFEHEERALMIVVLVGCCIWVIVPIRDNSLPACEVCSPKTKTAVAAIVKYKFRSLASYFTFHIPYY